MAVPVLVVPALTTPFPVDPGSGAFILLPVWANAAAEKFTANSAAPTNVITFDISFTSLTVPGLEQECERFGTDGFRLSGRRPSTHAHKFMRPVAVPLANRRQWTEVDLANLKSTAGKYPPHQIAIALNRGSAVVMKAFELRISQRQKLTSD